MLKYGYLFWSVCQVNSCLRQAERLKKKKTITWTSAWSSSLPKTMNTSDTIKTVWAVITYYVNFTSGTKVHKNNLSSMMVSGDCSGTRDKRELKQCGLPMRSHAKCGVQHGLLFIIHQQAEAHQHHFEWPLLDQSDLVILVNFHKAWNY